MCHYNTGTVIYHLITDSDATGKGGFATISEAHVLSPVVYSERQQGGGYILPGNPTRTKRAMKAEL